MKFVAKFVPVIAMSALLVGYALHSAPVSAKHKVLRHHRLSRGRKPLRLAFVSNNASDYWTVARKGTEAAQRELSNVQVDFLLPADGTAEAQKQIVDELLAKGIDGIAISPVDAENEGHLLNAAAAKTLLFTQDSDAPGSKRACYVGTDNHAAGMQAGREIKKALPHGGKIMLFVGRLDASNAKDRRRGIMDALKGSRVKVIDTLTDDAYHTKAKSNAVSTLVKYPDIAGLVGLWSYNGPAILSAVKDAGRIGKVKIVCFDEEPDTLQGIQSGAIAATIVQQPYEFGYQSIKLMARYLRDNKSVVPAHRHIYVPTRVINKRNVRPFKGQLEQWRAQ